MNAFGEALNLVFMRGSECFSSYSTANGLNLRMHSHEFKFLFEVNESQTAFHEFKSLFEVNGFKTQIAFP